MKLEACLSRSPEGRRLGRIAKEAIGAIVCACFDSLALSDSTIQDEVQPRVHLQLTLPDEEIRLVASISSLDVVEKLLLEKQSQEQQGEEEDDSTVCNTVASGDTVPLLFSDHTFDEEIDGRDEEIVITVLSANNVADGRDRSSPEHDEDEIMAAAPVMSGEDAIPLLFCETARAVIKIPTAPPSPTKKMVQRPKVKLEACLSRSPEGKRLGRKARNMFDTTLGICLFPNSSEITELPEIDHVPSIKRKLTEFDDSKVFDCVYFEEVAEEEKFEEDIKRSKPRDDDEDDATIVLTASAYFEEVAEEEKFELESKKSDEYDIVLTASSCDNEIPRLLKESSVMLKLACAMPDTLHGRLWKRVYSIARDGDSFDSFINKVKGRENTLIVVQTTSGDILGGFADASWDHGCRNKDGRFFGTGRSFLFAVDGDTHAVGIFRWQGVNEYSQLCRKVDGCIGMGGGGGTFGIFLQDNFTKGSSGACETYGNTRTLASTECFDILNFEVYGFEQFW